MSSSKKKTGKYKVHQISSSEADLLEIYKYVFENDSEENADDLYENIYATCKRLERYAHRGHVPPELKELGVEEFLEIHYKPYRILYRVINNKVFIYCILDGQRDLQKLLQERLLRE